MLIFNHWDISHIHDISYGDRAFQSLPFVYGTVFRSTSHPQRLLHSLEDILLRTVLFIKLLSCLRSDDIVILDTLIVLLTYLLTYLLTTVHS